MIKGTEEKNVQKIVFVLFFSNIYYFPVKFWTLSLLQASKCSPDVITCDDWGQK